MHRLFATAILVAALGTACSNPFAEAQKADTIEAYEQFLSENPNSPYATQAAIRLEELMLEKAEQEGTVAAFDAVLERFPKGKGQLYDKIWEERREALYREADRTGDAKLWKQYMEEYPSGDRKKKVEARARLKVGEYADRIELGPPEMEQINLARDPDGPLNGWEFRTDVTWKGDEPLQTLILRVSYLDAEGNPLDHDDWPLVATHMPGYLPMRPGFDKPLKKGETRTWVYTTGDLPPGWAKKVRIQPVRIGFPSDEKDR